MDKLIVPASKGFSKEAIAVMFANHSSAGFSFQRQEAVVAIMQAYVGQYDYLIRETAKHFSKFIQTQVPMTAQKIFRKIIDSRYKSYSTPATRTGEESYLERLLTLDSEMLNLDHLRGALGTVGFLRDYNEQTGQLTGYPVVWFIDVYFEGDPDPRGVIYPMANVSGKKADQIYVVWTDTEHFMLTASGNIVALHDNPDMVNPYGVIPVLFAHNGPPSIVGEFRREPAADLANAQMMYNVYNTQLSVIDMYQSGSQMYMTGTDPPSKEMFTGPDEILYLPEPGGKVGFATPGGKPEALIDSMRWVVETAAQNYNLKIKWGEASSGATSGEHQRILEVELTSAIEGDQNAWRQFESERFEVDSAILAAHGIQAGNVEDYAVDFASAHIPLSWPEQQAQYDYKKSINLYTDVDIAMDLNPDLTREQAKELIEINKAINQPTAATAGLSLAERLAAPAS
jgi:hypothetical protein